jgi:hypothetical protein
MPSFLSLVSSPITIKSDLDNKCYQVAVINWSDDDGIAEAICNELVALNHKPVCFKFNEQIPGDVEVVFSFAPYGRFLQIPRQLAKLPPHKRPVLAHWNTENPPDLRLPWLIVKSVGACRSWLDRLNDTDNPKIQLLNKQPPLSWIQKRMHKFRYVGEYHYAYRQGWLDILVETSEIYARLHHQHGLPAIVIPWGTAPSWYANLNCERDIDVLWMGTRRTRRRSKLLDQIWEQLVGYGLKVHVADNVENPFIFDEERTLYLNRAKITLNLLPTWYDNAFPYRFHMAAGNRSLVISESMLPHCPVYEAGKHYVSTSPDKIVDTILYYLEHEDERLQIVENAYQLVATKLTFQNSIKTMMNAVNKVYLSSRQ